MDATSTGPRDEYPRRLDARRAAVTRDARAFDRIALARGIVFVAGVVWLVLTLSETLAASPAWAIAPAAIFVALMILHTRVADRLTRSRRAVTYWETALARLEGHWAGTGPTGERYRDPHHPYADDLDVFGPASLFQLICRARTRLGEDTLAEWLARPADGETVRARHAALKELRNRIELREELALLDAEVHDDLDQNRLAVWSREPARPIPVAQRAFAAVLGMAMVAAIIAWLVFDAGLAPLLVVLVVESVFAFRYTGRLKESAKSVDEAASGLAILAQVLELIERERFDSPRLARLRAQLDTEGKPPSRHIARLHLLVEYLNNCLQNQFFAPLAFLLCLPAHFLHAVETWRARYGPRIVPWLDAVGEFEALSALAGYHYEHPGDPFPELLEGERRFVGEALGHPLLAEEECVRNDVSLGEGLQLLLVSGSNMSGKSTLLRTIGTNAVLALAGAPVRAKSLGLTPLQVGTAMRIHDSLQEGTSLFFAVLGRLKAIVELSHEPRPLLFLLDEILQGTNSHDRRIGAEGVIRRLLDSNAFGLVTTHDLALTEIVESLGERAVNVHFEDHLEDGRMTFDYRLRPGVVRRSNALELMRMMGLEV
ncbi:MAG: hypothetical protein WD066_11930 [Planctomycetaceae bacterium]